MAQLEVGRVAIALDEPEDVILRELLAAYGMRPVRAEPLHELARYFRLRRMYAKAYVFGAAAAGLSRPDDVLFVAQDVYDWRALDEVGVAAYWIGNYLESRRACEEILGRVEAGLAVPEDDVRRIRENLTYSTARLPATTP